MTEAAAFEGCSRERELFGVAPGERHVQALRRRTLFGTLERRPDGVDSAVATQPMRAAAIAMLPLPHATSSTLDRRAGQRRSRGARRWGR